MNPQVTTKISVILLAILCVFAYINTKYMVESYAWVNHTYEVIETLDQIRNLMVDSETSARGYVIKGEQLYLTPYEKAQCEVQAEIDYLQNLMRDNERQQRRVKDLKISIRKKSDQILTIIKVRKDKGFQEAAELVKNGQQYMDEIRQSVQDMKNAENALLIQRLRVADGIAYKSLIVFPVLILADLLFTTITIGLIKNGGV